MNEITVNNETMSKPIVIPGIRRATITMISEQYRIPYTKITTCLYNHKDEYDVITPNSRSEFENLLAKDIQFVCKTDRSGNVGYLFTNAAFANVKFGRTPLISEHDIPKIVNYCHTAHRGRKKSVQPKDEPKTELPEALKSKIEKDATEKLKKDGVLLVKDIPNPIAPETNDIFDSSEEETLLLNFAKAFKSGEIMNLMTAALALDSYRQREIAELKSSSSANTIPWISSSAPDKVISVLALAIQALKYDTWCRVYDGLMNNYNIDLRARNKRPLINGLKENEYHLFYQVVADICKSKYIDLRLVLADAGINTAGLSVMVKL